MPAPSIPTAEPAVEPTSTTRVPIAFAGTVIAVVAVAAAAYAFTALPMADLQNPAWFVSLLVFVAAALTVIAVVFRQMGLAHLTEAFGLPPGTIRTLLAMGIMVLFAVLAISHVGKTVTVLSASPAASAVQASADPRELDAEIRRYREARLIAVVADRGSVAASTPAVLSLYRLDESRPTDVIETQKQVITTIVTLLTTVIGFYFGSRSTESAIEKNAGRSTEPAPADPELDKIAAELPDVESRLDAACKRLDELVALPPDPDRTAELSASLTRLQADRTRLVAERDAIRQALGAAVTGSAGATGEGGSDPKGPAATLTGRVGQWRNDVQTFARGIEAFERLQPRG